MQLSTVLWLALLVAMAVLFVVTLRRMSTMVARTRDLERFQRSVEGVGARFAGEVGPLVRALDETRRHAGDPATLAQQLTGAQATIEELRAQCREIPAPAGLVGVVAAMAGDLDRAARAASLVEHGLGAMATASLGRDLEAQTSLKRGTLNLRHAQEAFAGRAREVASLRPADLAGGMLRATGQPPLPVYPTVEPEELEGRFDPRM